MLKIRGVVVPQTWDELLALTEQIAKDGDPAWAIGIESGAATGWAATDWIEDIMLRTTSPENYDKWVKGELPFTDPIVKNAVGKMSEIWLNKDYVYGGTKSIVTTAFGDAPKVMFDNPPKAWMHRQASFITSFFPQNPMSFCPSSNRAIMSSRLSSPPSMSDTIFSSRSSDFSKDCCCSAISYLPTTSLSKSPFATRVVTRWPDVNDAGSRMISPDAVFVTL